MLISILWLIVIACAVGGVISWKKHIQAQHDTHEPPERWAEQRPLTAEEQREFEAILNRNAPVAAAYEPATGSNAPTQPIPVLRDYQQAAIDTLRSGPKALVLDHKVRTTRSYALPSRAGKANRDRAFNSTYEENARRRGQYDQASDDHSSGNP